MTKLSDVPVLSSVPTGGHVLVTAPYSGSLADFAKVPASSLGGGGYTPGGTVGQLLSGTGSNVVVGSGLQLTGDTLVNTASGSGSALVVALSLNGITNDATNGIEFGATAPAGAGQSAAINTVIANAAAAAGAKGFEILWDVQVALGAPIYFYSNMTIRALPNCGAIMRASSNCPMFRMHGTETAPSSNTSTASQNTWGKIDPTKFGTTTGSTDYRYRVFDPSFINVRNIALIGGLWNGNNLQQAVPDGAGGELGTVTYGFSNIAQWCGVDRLLVRDGRFILSVCFAFMLANCRGVTIENVDIDNHQTTEHGQSCIQAEGPSTQLRYQYLRTKANDDHLAFNADDTITGRIAFLTSGINYCCSGAITDVTVQDWTVWQGYEQIQSFNCLRILSNVARVDNIRVSRVSGTIANAGIVLTKFPDALLTGPGNYGHIVLEDFTVDGSVPQFSTIVDVDTIIDCLEYRHRNRIGAASAYPDIHVKATGAIKSLVIDGEWTVNTAAANNQPILWNEGQIDLLKMDVRSYRTGVAAGAAPLLRNGGSIGTAVIDAVAVAITNLVDVTAGTITTLILRGLHRGAGGGSPVAISSGATITNLIAGSGVTPLAYNHASVALVSGSGTVIRTNDYSEGAAGPILDSITSTVAAAYSVRKLRTAYSGYALKVRRSSDNTTQDIGFDGSGNLDTTALLAFVGSNSGYVDTWYNQGATANANLVQATTANQPRIVNAGALEISGAGRAGLRTTVAAQSHMRASPFNILTGTVFGTANVFSFTAGNRILSYCAASDPYDFNSTDSAALLLYDAAGGTPAVQGLFIQSTAANESRVTPFTPSTTLHQMILTVNGSGANVGTLDGAAHSADTPLASPNLVTGGMFLISAEKGTPTAGADAVHAEVIVIQGTFAPADQTTCYSSQSAYFGTP